MGLKINTHLFELDKFYSSSFTAFTVCYENYATV